MQIELINVECPHCKKWYSHSDVMSYSTHGKSECWSDGKCIGDDSLEYSFLPFSKCDNCSKFFWFEDCRKIKDYEIRSQIESPKEEFVENEIVIEFLKENLEDYQENKLDLNYPPPHWHWGDITALLIEDFITILEDADNLPVVREIYIRTKLWQHINDYIRDADNFFMQIIKNNREKLVLNNQQYQKHERIRLDNLNCLSELMNKVEGSEYENKEIILIEIERELSHFEKAKLLIDFLDATDKHNHTKFINKSLKLISKKSTKAFKI